ncbi:aspartic proteinase yapsin-3 [Trichomonascus vanleenenianus]|uniref:pepsin-like aspartic protease n=1 Tax=Trichomonascus vanleenenianus TaxID=2268995 RepID=UPI003ECA59B1
MKFALPLALSAGAIALANAEAMPEGALKLDIERVAHPVLHRRTVPDLGDELLTRSAQEFADRIDNQKYFYSTTVSIGTPPQSLNLLLDTGSSDTWVYSPSSKFQGQGKPKPNSFFDPSKSNSFKSNGTSYKIQYGIGTTTGQWGTDSFKIGGATLKSFSIGVADSGDVSQGIIGIGRPEAEITYKQGVVYNNLPMALAAQGVTNTAAYSLYLNDLNSKSGTILFGAVDHSRYTGQLYSFPISHPKHLGIKIQNMHSDGRAQEAMLQKPVTAILDSGTSLSYLPQDAVGNIHEYLNANPSFTIGEKYYCDCNVTANLVLNFGPTEIKVPNFYFLWPIETIVNPVVANFAFPANSCYIGIENSQPGMDFALFGDNFMRAMYVVYDLKHNRIAIAQSNLRGDTSKIEVIKDKIPGAIESN